MNIIEEYYAEIADAKRILAKAYNAFHAKGVTNRQKAHIIATIIRCQNNIVYNVHIINVIKNWNKIDIKL